MRRLFMFAAAALLVSGSFAFAAAAPKAIKAHASGTLESVDASAQSIVVRQGGRDMTFVVAPDAKVTQGTKSLAVGDLSQDVGQHIKIEYKMDGSTKMADRVELAQHAAPHNTSPSQKK